MQRLSRHFLLRPIVAHVLAGMGLFSIAPQVWAQPVASAALQSPSVQIESHRLHQDHVIGTSLDVVVVGAHQAQATAAMNVILAEIRRLDAVLSVWRADSEISQLNQSRGQQVSADLYAVLQACETWKTATCGAFSARMGQLLDQWELSQGVQTPDAALLAVQGERIADAVVQFDANTQHVSRPAGVRFAPDALAKGYVIDRAIMAVRQAMPEIAGLMVDIGGDVRVWGQAPRSTGWQVGVRQAGTRGDNQAPQQVLSLHNQAVALSGQGARDLAGQSHVLDPHTGQPLNHIEQSVVVAPTAADADALATALAVMGAEQGMALIERLAGVEAHITDSSGRQVQSSGWVNMLGQRHPQADWHTVASAAAASSSWPMGYSARLDYELPKIEVADYHAPYVVIWVTDANKQLVRTLNVWGDDRKWLDSNYVWWRRYGRKLDNIDTVAKPSRQAGRYSVVWDGLNDAGQRVEAGQYTVHIEAAREHGQHSYQTFPLAVAAQASQQKAPAKDELGALTLRFDRVF